MTEDQPAATSSAHQARAGSSPSKGDAENNRRLEELAASNAPAANLAKALIGAGHSIPAAIAMVMSVVAVPPPPPTRGSAGGPSTPIRDVAPTIGTPIRREADVGRIRGGSQPPPSASPSANRARRARESPSSSPASKRTKTASSAAVHRAGPAAPLFNPNPTYLNPHMLDELWPSDRVVAKTKRLEFVQFWNLTPAGCRYAEEQRVSGTDEAMLLQTDGSLKHANNSRVVCCDLLDLWTFQAAAGLWVRVARKVKVPEHIVCEMALLNNHIFNHPDWQTDPTTLMVWHTHQRASWSRYQANPEGEEPFVLHALNPAAYTGMQISGAVKKFNAAEARAAEAAVRAQEATNRAQAAEAALRNAMSNRQGQSSKSRDPAPTNFRPAGGAGLSISIRDTASSARFSYTKACLRCGASATPDHQVNKCMPTQRTDGSPPILETDPVWRNGIRFRDTTERVCIPFNLPGGCRGDCHGNAYRCTWCGAPGHSHQDCRSAPHRR
ncbi:unnamed protein product [Tilletia controversa]|nr:unnamed protein product [Tilletia controversa]